MLRSILVAAVCVIASQVGSVTGLQTLSGKLFQFTANNTHLTAFYSGPRHADQAVVLLPGLQEGPLSLPWTNRLGKRLAKKNWALVQPTLSSSYLGFGTGTLQRDTGELDLLVEALVRQGKRRIVMIGHSTGSQQTLHYARFGSQRKYLAGGVLQAALSDREYYVSSMPDHAHWVQMATQMRAQGQGQEMMPRRAFSFAAVTADRFFSLCARGGDDDMFSSDLTPTELAAIYKPVSVPLAMVLSGSDEYMPKNVSAESLLANQKAAYSGFTLMKVVPGADHIVSGAPQIKQLLSIIFEFIDKLDKKA
ncbi:hypothetical protein THASP1DRAFT_33395 [Thamnocephalis sphaerospora]|uniref:Alpha/Beta hydrolase protein n=1 Tax=Thamnocephalis sphaerospora TaxID=78915 RepID=A0A4P9XGP8_9FUNG|nr:hypothetical protein THASP1DRAFT_33395 [Thamnocephalis sphaerospora]|eukprot:RKP04797.1 hypothetical protein THASP1DRAFT_33395 [Thamnocephalis sphaerospora]